MSAAETARIPRPLLVDLREALQVLYLDGKASERLVTEVGLEEIRVHVNFDWAPKYRWFKIIDWAQESDGGLDKIIEGALSEYADDRKLRVAVAAIRAVPAAEQDAPGAPSARPVRAIPGSAKSSYRLVDRVDVVAYLDRELDRIATEQVGRAILLVGESGVGKSRLAEEAIRLGAERRMTVLQAHCIGQAAEALLPIRDSLAVHRGERSVEDMLLEGGPTLTDYVPFVESFLSIGHVGGQDRPLGGSRPGGVYEGLSRVLVGLAEERGLCLIVEDLTDADRDTLMFLEYLQRKSVQGRLLTIATVKKDLAEKSLNDILGKWTLQGTTIQEVPPLGREDAAAFIALLPDGADLDPAGVDEIYTLTNGNPYFIELILRNRADRAAEANGAGAIPSDIQTVMESRLTLLKKTRPFVEAAAVALENTQSLDLTAHIAGVKQRSALAFLRDATEKHCLREDDQGGIWFVQELLRRVAYDRLGPQARTAMHASAAQWLEKAGLLASAAYHYGRAGRAADLVRTVLAGAAQAEFTGAYPKAAELYELAGELGGDEADPRILGPRLTKAYIVLGELAKASAALDSTPDDAPSARLLRSEITFLGGDVEGALEQSLLTLQVETSDRLDAQIWLAGIYLYLGQLETAANHARQALDGSVDPTVVARCKGIIGAAALFAGDVDEGDRWFLEAMATLEVQPVEERDRFIYSTILGNLAQVREVRGDWPGSRAFHEQALTLRREVSDARGVLQSTRGILECDIGLGAFDSVRAQLQQARELAARIGDRVEAAKLDHDAVRLELATGAPGEAVRLADSALRQFRGLGVAYDIAQARFSLAAAYVADGRPRRAIEEAAAARIETERMGFGLLRRLFPTLGFAYPGRIASGLASSRGRADDPSIVEEIAKRIIVTGRVELGGDAAAVDAPLALSDASPGDLPSLGLPVGWAVPISAVQERRALVMGLADAAGAGPEAGCAASVVAACAAWSLEGAASNVLLDVAIEEAAGAVPATGADKRIEGMLAAVARGAWVPDRAAGDLGPYEVVTRALWCIAKDPQLLEAIASATAIGGGATTVAVVVGGLLGPREDVPIAPTRLAEGLAELRTGVAGG